MALTLINLLKQVKGILPSANGGTGNGFTKFSGATTTEKTYTLPDFSTTILTTHDAVTVPQGGTGLATLTVHNVLLGEGSSNVGFAAPGSTSGYVLTSNGASADPSFQANAAAINFADDEAPSGTINGSNDTFTLAQTPSPAGSLELFKNGQLMQAGGADYTLTTNSIVFVSGAIPATGDVLFAFYRY